KIDSISNVLCRVKAIAICGTDPHLIAGDFPGYWPPKYPFIAGHEWAGEIVAVGPEVVGFKVGDLICAESHKGCGICDRCMEGRYTICANYGKPETGHRHYGFTTQGGYAEYCAISAKAIHHLPSNVSFAEGALIDTAGIALHGVERGPVEVGETVVVSGPGPVGLLVTQFAKIAGASKIIVMGCGVEDKPRFELAKKYGADETIDIKVNDPIKKIKELTGGVGADVALECSGSVDSYRTILDFVRFGGKVVGIGLCRGVEVPLVVDKIVLNELDIHGIKANPNTIEPALRLISKGMVELKSLISTEFPLTEFDNALETFSKKIGGAIKVIVRP
ncbi:alcohol dehydrogenase catalytic domain-containing protein, partial [Candidatus Bathyarchaeota archaeon]|nr:alcohol dehydrogenase catalytic domain-containing protein [Candidatus Bathyarchaeota archaeon]